MKESLLAVLFTLVATSGSAETVFIEAETFTPNHGPFSPGPQTWLRVTVGEVYEQPIQTHIFADHHRAPCITNRLIDCRPASNLHRHQTKNRFLFS